MQSEAVAVDNRGEFPLWAIERAKAVVGEQGTALAPVALDGED